MEGLVDLIAAGYTPKWFTNLALCRATSLIRHNALPLRHATNSNQTQYFSSNEIWVVKSLLKLNDALHLRDTNSSGVLTESWKVSNLSLLWL